MLLLRRVFTRGAHHLNFHRQEQLFVKTRNNGLKSSSLVASAAAQRRCLVTQNKKSFLRNPSSKRQTSTSTTTSSAKKAKNILPMKFVTSPTLKKALPIIGHSSYIGLASGFLMTDMLQLRILLVGGYTGLVLFHLCHVKPLRIPLRWSALFVFVNAGAAAFLISDRYGYTLTEEEELQYKQHFSKLTRGQYYQLLKMGVVEDYEDGDVLTVEGEFCPKLYFIVSGKGCKVYHHHAFAANIEAGGFVNDVAFQQSHFDHTPRLFYDDDDDKDGNNKNKKTNDDNESESEKVGEQIGAYGTVVTMGQGKIIVWDQNTLRKHLKSRPDMERNMKYCLSEHLVKTLLWQREAAHLRQQSWNHDRNNNSTNNNSSNKNKKQLQEERKKAEDEQTGEASEKDEKNGQKNERKPNMNIDPRRRKTLLRRSPSNDHIEWINDDNRDERNKNKGNAEKKRQI